MVVVRGAETYEPGTDTWTETSSMSPPRSGHALVPLSGKRALAVGGYDGGWGVCDDVNSSEVWHASTGQWYDAGDLSEPRIRPGFVVLPDGRPLIVGGMDCGDAPTATAMLFVPE